MTLTLEAPRTMSDRPKDFNMADLVAQQAQEAATGKRPAREYVPPAPDPDAPRRVSYRTLRTPDGLRPSPRQEARDARVYAQSWYWAVLFWEVREVTIPYSFHYDPLDMVEHLTAAQGPRAPVRYLRTPIGEYTEGEVGTVITTMARSPVPEMHQLGRMLDRARHERSACMVNLLREDGRWERNREAAVRYGVAALTLAVQLRDQNAEAPLALLQAELRALGGGG